MNRMGRRALSVVWALGVDEMVWVGDVVWPVRLVKCVWVVWDVGIVGVAGVPRAARILRSYWVAWIVETVL